MLVCTFTSTSPEYRAPRCSARFVPRPELDVKKHGASDEVVAAAAAVMDKMFWSLSPSNVDILRGLSIHLHIIPRGKKATDVAEFRKLKDKTAPNGRSYDSVRAVDAMRSGSRIVTRSGKNPSWKVSSSRRSRRALLRVLP